MKIFCAFVQGVRPGYLAFVPRKQNSNLNWVHGFHEVLELFFSGCCLWGRDQCT